jgi:putative zinc finger/helix-turn-helix YgiT family protein
MNGKKNIRMFCEKCEEFRRFHVSLQQRTVEVRGESITADVSVATCPVCRYVQLDPSTDADPMVAVYAEYRRQHGLLMPQEMVEIRTKYALSPEAFGSVTGMSPASVYRYEGGALQDSVHNALMLLCSEPVNMLRLLERDPKRLSRIQYNRFVAAMRTLGYDMPPLTRKSTKSGEHRRNAHTALPDRRGRRAGPFR